MQQFAASYPKPGTRNPEPGAFAHRWLHRFALLFVFATFILLILGGTVTSKGAGLAVPDWPTTFNYHMFLFPPDLWVGGIFWEHLHRLMGSLVGLLAIIMSIWLWHAAAPAESDTATQSPRTAVRGWLKWFGIATLLMVIAQGIMGGLRVTQLSTALAVFHGVTAQIFFCMTVLIAAATSRWWVAGVRGQESGVRSQGSGVTSSAAAGFDQSPITDHQSPITNRLSVLRIPCIILLVVLFIQLALGATMRHHGAGLAIPDFPTSYGGVVPPLTDEGIENGMAQFAADPETWSHDELHQTYTPMQVAVHFAHRVWAVIVLLVAAWAVAAVHRRAVGESKLTRPAKALALLLLGQVALGALTIWSVRHPEVATAHQTLGAIILATAALLTYRLQHLAATQNAVGPALPANGLTRATGMVTNAPANQPAPAGARWPAQPALPGGRA